MKFLDEIDTTLTLLIVIGIGIIGYFVYDWIQNGDAGPTDPAGQTSSLLGLFQGTNSVDPNTGASNGFVNGLDNLFFTTSTPGGGETSGTSETYTGALTETLTSPWQTFKSIFEF